MNRNRIKAAILAWFAQASEDFNFHNDIRQENNWGYDVLPMYEFDEALKELLEEFKELEESWMA